MKKINSKAGYEKTNKRIEKLLNIVGNETPETNKDFIELNKLSDLVADYEEKNYSMQPSNLIEMVHFRMYQRKLKQKDLAKLLNTKPSRISEFLNGKLKLTYSFAQKLYNKLNIDADLIFKN